LLTHTHSTSTNCKARITVSDELGGTYYTPLDTTNYEYTLGDTTGNKEFNFNVQPFNYVRLETYAETAVNDTVVIDISKTTNS